MVSFFCADLSLRLNRSFHGIGLFLRQLLGDHQIAVLAGNAQRIAQFLDIADQVGGGVVAQRRRRAGTLPRAPPPRSRGARAGCGPGRRETAPAARTAPHCGPRSGAARRTARDRDRRCLPRR